MQMALTQSRANRILDKLGFPSVRRTNHFEEALDAYGVKMRWVIDRQPFQSLDAYPTLTAALAANLENHWDTFDRDKLTAKELRELRGVPSQIASYI
jgi:hypothetical protein